MCKPYLALIDVSHPRANMRCMRMACGTQSGTCTESHSTPQPWLRDQRDLSDYSP